MSEEDELRGKLEQPASSLYERVQILSARSKFIRLHRERQTNIETAKAVLGSCPDMCPEFERYFREENKQLSPLEMINNEPDPHAMVKEYRRAGADQEEPLPNELRSSEVLTRTMDYLICNIIDRVDQEPGIVGDWYDFVWSRSRAIRKDITQQHLSDLVAVGLLEKCARFHIHCSHALIEEEPNVFDSKINHENLVKCLQSLKDFYNDLNNKNIQSPNEPEFRGYYLILNLSRPDILREVKYLSARVKSSDAVKFSLKCHFAMTTNNFIKFFDLVKSTTYLNACILHRYFYDVRFQAFRAMRKSFTIPNQVELYPFSELINQLGFEHEDEVRIFCSSIGLECDEDNVLLRRGKTNDGRASIQIIRGRKLIESKRHGKSLSEIINGGQLPVNPYRKFPLFDSFDASGYLKKETYLFMDRKNRLSASSPVKEMVQASQPIETDQFTEGEKNSVAIRIAQTIMGEVIQETIDVHANRLKTYIKREICTYREAERLSNSLINFTIAEIIKSTFHSIVQKVRVAEIRERERGYQAALDTVATQACDSIINYYIFDYLKNCASSILAASIQDHNVRKSRLLVESIVTEVISDEIKTAVDHLKTQEAKINFLRNKRSWKYAGLCFIHWKRRCARAKRYRRVKLTFPASNVECLNPRIESIYLKRKAVSTSDLLASPTSVTPPPEKQSRVNRNELTRSSSFSKTLKPKMFAEQITSLSSGIISPISQTESPLSKLLRKLENERDLSESLNRSIETYREYSCFLE